MLATRSRLQTLSVTAGLSALMVACGPSPSNTSGGGSADTTSTSLAKSTVSLSASISGVNQPGLVLMVNGQDVAVNPTDGSLTLVQDVPEGTTFTVEVKDNPQGLTCSIAGGSGTVSKANIANIVVTCSPKSAALGGTVIGLTEAGLKLANGATKIDVAKNATSFSFGDLASGTSYAITVDTQPTGLACAVNNGSGVATGSAISNAEVTCSSQPFNLGGSIAGLGNHTGLTLSNGSDTYTVPANATSFTMPGKVNFGSSYSLTVQNAPSGMTCTASSNTGTMPAADVSNALITCAHQSYTVAGSVSGLNASGLVLTMGSQTLNIGSGVSNFSFPTAIAYESPYAVTVQTQPGNRICSVSNGSGNMGAANVSNVSVTCAQTAFTVGGTISGLGDGSLVLTNNNGDDTTISANATSFSMMTAVANSANYSIAVKTQPASGGTNPTVSKTCSVSNGAGSVNSADVSNVSITCSATVSFTTPGTFSWTPPSGVTSVTVVATGGGGGASSHSFGFGGHAGIVTSGALAVTPSASIPIEVGAGGGFANAGISAGLGGGLSSFNVGSLNQVIAGGGGGQGIKLDGFGQPFRAGSGGNGCSAAGATEENFVSPTVFLSAYGGTAGADGLGGSGGIASYMGYTSTTAVNGSAGSNGTGSGGAGASYGPTTWGGGGGRGYGGGGGGAALIRPNPMLGVTGAQFSGGGASGGCTGGINSVASNGGIRPTGTGVGGNGSVVISY